MKQKILLKTASLLLLLLSVLPDIIAQPMYSYTAAGPIANTIPFSSGTTQNFRQWIYYPTDFPGAPASGTITAIFIQASAAASPNFTNLTVKLGQTSANDFTSTTYLTGLTTVYNGSYSGSTVSGNWVMITLTTPYFYNFTQNLVVEVSQTGYSPGFSVNQTNTGTVNRSLFGAATSTSGSFQPRLGHFGFNVLAGPPCNAPTGLAASGVTWTSANFNWNTVSGSSGYEYQMTTSATAPTTAGTPIAVATYNATGLNPGTNYWFWVRNKCSATSFSSWVSVPFSTPSCAGVNAASINVNNLTMTSADLSWSSVTASQGYEYAFGTSATPPATGTPTAALIYNATGLTAGMTYYFHVRSKCSTGVFSGWVTKSFTTLFGPCDAPAPLTIEAVNMYGANMHWAPSPHVVQGYQYALTTTFIAPTTGISLTTDTAFTANNLVSGQTYYFWVRTHCGTNPLNNVANLSSWTVDSFMTPSTCGQPVAAVVSNITSNTAQMDWLKYPSIAGYEYVINTNPTPPPSSFSGAIITFNTLAAANLFSGTNYYFHLRIRCNATNASPWTSTPFSTPPVCTAAPSGVSVTSIAANTASFHWSPAPDAQQYQYSVTTTNLPDPNSNTYTSQPSATVGSLTPNTSYYFHVRTYCSPEDLSGWETIPFFTGPVSVNAINDEAGDIRIYPNPVQDILKIEAGETVKGKLDVVLTNLKGQVMKHLELSGTVGEMNMSDLPQGMYLIRCRDAESSKTIKVSKL